MDNEINRNDNQETEGGSNKGLIIAVILVLIIGIAIFAASDDEMDQVANDDDTAMVDEDMDDDMIEDGDTIPSNQDIVENAMATNSLSTLVAAVQAAGLVETLQGEGPFTVFAPTNSAFEALPEGTVDTLLMPENQDQLASVLTYHVVPGSFTSSDLTDGQELETVNGETITIGLTETGVTVNGSAMVEAADVASSNGVVHIIDSVLIPSS